MDAVWGLSWTSYHRFYMAFNVKVNFISEIDLFLIFSNTVLLSISIFFFIVMVNSCCLLVLSLFLTSKSLWLTVKELITHPTVRSLWRSLLVFFGLIYLFRSSSLSLLGICFLFCFVLYFPFQPLFSLHFPYSWSCLIYGLKWSLKS